MPYALLSCSFVTLLYCYCFFERNKWRRRQYYSENRGVLYGTVIQNSCRMSSIVDQYCSSLYMAYCQVNWSTETVIWMGNSINLCMRGCGEWRLSFDKCQQRAKAVVWGDIPWRNDDGTSRITDHWSPLTSRMTRSVYTPTRLLSRIVFIAPR